MAITPNSAAATIEAANGPDAQRSRLDWGAALAGATVATAIAYVLTTFGSAIGLSLTSPFPGRGVSTPVLFAAIALWVVWVSASSYMAGGYIAGRMRRRLFEASEHEADVRDAIHGIVVWAVAALFGALLIGLTAAGAAKTGAQAAATAVSGAAQGAALGAGAAAGTAASGEQSADPLRGIVERMMRATGATGGDPGAAAESAGEVGRIVKDGLAQGDVPEEDRAYLAQVVARTTGLAEPEARARVDQGIEQAKAAAQQAREAADKARKAAIIAAFGLAAALLIGAVAAAWGATLGGRHRDQGTVHQGWLWAR